MNKRDKKPLYFHIGMGKTGTTALQNFFGENRKVLSKRGVCYPKHGSISNAHHLMSPYIPPYLVDSWDFMTPDQWAPKLSKVSEEAILLSSELVGWTTESDIQTFCNEVSRWFDLHIVIYVRRQDNIAMASYNQQVKVGQQVRHIKAALKRRVKNFDYLKLVTPWAEQLGEEKIQVRVYEHSQFHKGDICRDFMHAVFQLEVDESFSLSAANHNPRLSANTSGFKVIINNFVDDKNRNLRFNELLTAYSAQSDDSATPLFSDYSALTAQKRLELLKDFEESNAAVARKFLGRDDGKLFLDPLPVAQSEEIEPDAAVKREQLRGIVLYLQENDPELVRWLGQQIDNHSDSLSQVQQFGAHILRGLLTELEAL